MKIQNPILKGFNPDPCICKANKDYYIATSTFEWFPGVQIHHSKDLKNWELISRPLNRKSQLDMIGTPDSSGVWAPCLTYNEEKFWLIYTDVKMLNGTYKDLNNYLVTCDSIDGKWNEPIYLNAKGFDPSLFHDDDGKKYLVQMVWDHRSGTNQFYGIVIQEYCHEQKKLVKDAKYIFEGTELGIVEGPHIYKKDEYYYLVVAEGGTSYNHAITVARSKNLFGPYEVHPQNPILTSRNNPKNPLQKAGHGSFIMDDNNNWYVVHLVGRPLTERGNCPLGRETAIQKLQWREDKWPYIVGGSEPSLIVVIDDKEEVEVEKFQNELDDFNDDKLNINFQTLRIPLGEDIMSLKSRKGYLRLYGRQSLNSKFVQAHVARRWQSFKFTAKTGLEFNPTNFQQSAGLVCYYNTENWMYINLSYDENLRKRYIEFITCNNMEFKFLEEKDRVYIEDSIKQVHFKVDVNYSEMRFAYSLDNVEWRYLKDIMDANKLSDDYIRINNHESFTGAFVGMCCQDVSGENIYADFDYFSYKEW